MTIETDTLKTWTNIGAVTTAKNTHESIKNVLESDKLSSWNYKTYLQGSYKNSTNIYGDSDVDVVVQLNSIFNCNKNELPDNERNLFDQVFPNSNLLLSDFKSDVLSVLTDHYGTELVSEGNKCIKIDGNSSRLPADVVVCNEYRFYNRFYGRHTPYGRGIIFQAKDSGRSIINYPLEHYDNGIEKNEVYHTMGNYKKSVRMFKNARNYLINSGKIDTPLAPSYYIECMIYNVPNNFFSNDLRETFVSSLYWLNRELSNNPDSFLCQNGITKLFGNTQEQWSTHNAIKLVSELIEVL